MTMGTQAGFPPTPDSLSAFSTLNLLRNYNQFLGPPGSNLMQVYHQYSSFGDFPHEESSRPGNLSFSPTIGAFQPYLPYPFPTVSPLPDLKSRQAFLTASAIYGRRPRGEKKPIPEDQKDDRYYERRKRNNQAAKKSRDARKLREDQIALRATLLEHENAILRAQLLTLREETQSLRQLMLSQKKSPGKGVLGKSECNLEGGDRLKKWESEFDFGGPVE